LAIVNLFLTNLLIVKITFLEEKIQKQYAYVEMATNLQPSHARAQTYKATLNLPPPFTLRLIQSLFKSIAQRHKLIELSRRYRVTLSLAKRGFHYAELNLFHFRFLLSPPLC
jgi:hypothetical protein